MTAGSETGLPVDLFGWPGIVVGVDGDGMITASNGKLEDLLGASVIGGAMRDRLDEESSARKWDRITAALDDSGVRRWELVFRGIDTLCEPKVFAALRASGDKGKVWLVEHPVDARVDAMSGEMAALNAELATTQRSLFVEQQRLKATLRELERSNAALDEFAHAVSHDLKAPLRAIISYAQLLEAEVAPALPAESREQLGRVAALGLKMRGMINAVLDYARAGQATGAPETTNTRALLEETVEFLAPPSDVQIVLAQDLPTFRVARVPFEQVFRNLLSNAVRYRRETGAEIRVTVSDAGACWHFEVADNGPGIAKWQQDRIWRLFQTTRPKEGTGIGLAIVKRIVDSQGGRVYVESEEGEGARFSVLWPKTPSDTGRLTA